MKRFREWQGLLVRTARLFDTAVFSALILFLLYVANAHRGRRVVLLLLYVLVFGCVHTIRSNLGRSEKRRADRRRDERTELLRLLLTDEKDVCEQFGLNHAFVIRKWHPDEGDVIAAIRSGAETICVAEIKPWMEEIAKLSGSEIAYFDLKAHLFPTEREAGIKGLARRLFASVGPNLKYWVLGCVLYALSFAVRYKIYYRAAALASLILAGIIGVLGKTGRGKIFPEFLDKTGRR